jgi:MFS family permease
MFIGMSYLPYSARWLALKGRIQEARQSLQFVTPDLPESELDAIKEAAEKASEATGSSFVNDYRRLTSPTVFPALVVGVGLVFFQQVTGQPSVLYYANTLFEDVGLSSSSSILLGIFKLIATLVTTFTVDRQGRKLLLYIGCSLMLCSLIGLGTAFVFPYTSKAECNSYLTTDTCPSGCIWNGDICNATGITVQKSVILICLFVYIGGYQVGFGPISWLMISEIFPLEVRGKAVSIAVVTNFFWNTVMTFFFPVELQYLGSAATFFLYAVVLSFGIYFIFSRVPETKGLSLEEIERFFLHNSLTPDSARQSTDNSESTDSENTNYTPLI